MAIISKTKVRKISTLLLHCQKKKNSFFHEILAAKSNPLDPKQNPLASCHLSHTLSLLFVLFQGLEYFTYKLFFFFNSARLGTTKCLHATSGHFYICPLSDVTSNFLCVEPWPINLRYLEPQKWEQYSQTISFPIWIITDISYSVPLYPG